MMTVSFVFINCVSKSFNKKLALKLIMLLLPEAMASILNMLIFLSFRWWQQILVTGIGACDSGSRNIVPTPGIQVYPPDLNVPINLCRDDSRPKLHLLWQLIRLKPGSLNSLSYIAHCLLFPCLALCDIFSVFFTCQRRCWKYWRPSINLDNDGFMTSTIYIEDCLEILDI